MDKNVPQGVKLGSKDKHKEAAVDLVRSAMKSGVIDSALLPMEVPSGDSYAWMLIKDEAFLAKAEPFAPTMPVNAANAVKRLTRKGTGKYKTAVLIRPCEVRAAVELVKLNQAHLDDLLLITYDCVGAVPTDDYIKDPAGKNKAFKTALVSGNFNSGIMKEVCSFCTDFSRTSSDLHLSLTDDGIFLSSNNVKGDDFLKNMKLEAKADLSKWYEKIESISSVRKNKKVQIFEKIKKDVDGLINFHKIFENCIGCHSCGSVCPICYCRQCFFDSTVNEQNSDLKFIRARQKGVLSFPPDKLMFHIGRLSHMSLSCVSCGLCSDACPVDIPVASVFSYVADQTQSAFDYKSGNSVGDALPMRDYKLEELGELGELSKSVDRQEGADA
ncbi:MAG: 4Fe-4S dicluster domain-containing protein [Candidatus Delongbacteria bacterium]|nr:4Fe-4S dicluster domain-containing protein [Candidatus Delongbacteria bacterium]MCG2761300.1 4Fe-4S dicluster domain-containing protein [Candidatus Delongbacteria bacterium]